MDLLKNEHLKLLLHSFVLGFTYGQILLEGQLYQGFACYGDHDQYGFINASCPRGSVIAPGSVTYGAKLRSLTNCTGYITANNTLEYYQLCCNPDPANKDCLQVKETESPYQSCTGRSACTSSIRAQWISLTDSTCTTSEYGSSYQTSVTSYMIFTYFCVEEATVYVGSSVDVTVNASIIYLWNTGYPYQQIPANTRITCSVEIETCSATISVITVEVNFPTTANGTCNYTIKILTSSGNVVQILSCAVYKNISSLYTGSDTYLQIEIENLSGNQIGKFWLGFQATTSTTFHLSCPGKNRRYCISTTATLPTTSTTTPTTANTTSRTPPTTSTMKTITSSIKTSIQTTLTTRDMTTLNSTNKSPPLANKSENDLKIELIVGVVLGAVLFIAVLFVLCILWHKWKKRKNIPKEIMIESNSSDSQLQNGIAPTAHFAETSDIRERKYKKTTSFDPEEENEKGERKKDRKRKKKKRNKEEVRGKHTDTVQNVQLQAKSKQVEGPGTGEQMPFPSDNPYSRPRMYDSYGTETAETGRNDGGSNENGQPLNEKRRKRTKKKRKHKKHQVALTEGVDARESQTLDHSVILDDTNTMLRGDTVPDDTKEPHKRRKKFKRKHINATEETNQAVNEYKEESQGKRKKNKKHHAEKEDNCHLYEDEKQLRQLVEPVHNFENQVLPSSDSK